MLRDLNQQMKTKKNEKKTKQTSWNPGNPEIVLIAQVSQSKIRYCVYSRISYK